MSFGQSGELVLTQAQNEKWFDSLALLPLAWQLQMIKQRLLADTNVFVKRSYPDGIRVKDSLGNRVYGAGKPLLITKKVYLQSDNITDRNKIINLTQLLNMKYIETITLMKGTDPKTTALYGSNAMNGVIFIKTKKKSAEKLFKKLKYNN